MTYYIKRKKRLFEEGETPAPQQNNNQNQAPEQNQNNPQQQTQTQTNQNAQQPAQDPKQAEIAKNVEACINDIAEAVKKNDPYILLAYDIPSKMQGMVKEFTTENPNAKESMDKWSVFKQTPSKENYDAFINSFRDFGNGGKKDDNAQQNAQQNQNNQQQNNAQPQQQQQVNPAPASTPEANAATATQTAAESMAKTFGEKLHENMNLYKKLSEAEKTIDAYWNYHNNSLFV